MFGKLIRRTMTEGSIPFGKAWLRSVIDRVDVDAATVRIIADKSNLEQVVVATNTPTRSPGPLSRSCPEMARPTRV